MSEDFNKMYYLVKKNLLKDKVQMFEDSRLLMQLFFAWTVSNVVCLCRTMSPSSCRTLSAPLQGYYLT